MDTDHQRERIEQQLRQGFGERLPGLVEGELEQVREQTELRFTEQFEAELPGLVDEQLQQLLVNAEEMSEGE